MTHEQICELQRNMGQPVYGWLQIVYNLDEEI